MEYREQVRNRLIAEATPFETKLYKVLDDMNIKYIKQHIVEWPPSFVVLDAYLPDHNIAIELDGLHHLLDLEKAAQDIARDDYLENIHGIKVVRLLNDAVYDKHIEKMLRRLLSPLRQSRL